VLLILAKFVYWELLCAC